VSKPIHVLGFAGSLRRNSFNKALIRAALEVVPEGVTLEIFDLEGIPPLNQDMEMQPPQKVREFKQKIRAADAILISTPEYNYSVAGVLKNALDWASRPPGDNSWEGKPVAVMSASSGVLGGMRAQYHLRQCFVFLNMHPINRPEVWLGHAAEKIDTDGLLIDEETRKKIRELIQALAALTRRLKQT
jgi:chromate reductase